VYRKTVRPTTVLKLHSLKPAWRWTQAIHR